MTVEHIAPGVIQHSIMRGRDIDEPESALTRARRWFAKNPDDGLTTEDIGVKFDTSLANARTIVKQLRATKAISRAGELYRAAEVR